jgi:hypothetical protein
MNRSILLGATIFFGIAAPALAEEIATSITLKLEPGAALQGPLTIETPDGCRLEIHHNGSWFVNRNCLSVKGAVLRIFGSKRQQHRPPV